MRVLRMEYPRIWKTFSADKMLKLYLLCKQLAHYFLLAFIHRVEWYGII